MASPFPGMDSYLESPTQWSDFHGRFVHAIADAINDRLPDNYVARIGEHVMVVTPAMVVPEGQARIPDVTVVQGPSLAGSRTTPPTATAVWPAVALENIEFLDDYTEAYVEVVRLPEREVVTVVELFSPTNKYGEGRGIYMRKRRDFLRQPVNIVELDLLRAGARLQFMTPLPSGHYYAFTTRADSQRKTNVYTWGVQSRLPVVPVPLRPPDADLSLDLSEPFDAAYQRGRYWKVIDYTQLPPPPTFEQRDADWIAQTARAGVKPS